MKLVTPVLDRQRRVDSWNSVAGRSVSPLMSSRLSDRTCLKEQGEGRIERRLRVLGAHLEWVQ